MYILQTYDAREDAAQDEAEDVITWNNFGSNNNNNNNNNNDNNDNHSSCCLLICGARGGPDVYVFV